MTAIDRTHYESAVLPHVDELYGTAVRMTRCRAEADDLLQETMTRAWTFWDKFEKGTNARAWMHRILRNTFINRYRKRRREREILGEVERLGREQMALLAPQTTICERGLGDEVSAALATLSESFRAVVHLVDIEGLSYHEAAARLGVPVGTIMSRLHRARRSLQGRLREYATLEGYLPVAA